MNIPEIVKFDVADALLQRADHIRGELEVLVKNTSGDPGWKAAAVADHKNRIAALQQVVRDMARG